MKKNYFIYKLNNIKFTNKAEKFNVFEIYLLQEIYSNDRVYIIYINIIS